jgi:hypothetical protein
MPGKVQAVHWERSIENQYDLNLDPRLGQGALDSGN